MFPTFPTVCIIDDNAELCDLLRIAFEIRDFRVLTAADGQEGLDLVLAEEPDLVVLDIKLPMLNGYEVLNRIRCESAIADTPVVLMTSLTAGSPVADHEWRDRVGVADFISKPFEPLDLVGRVTSILADVATRGTAPTPSPHRTRGPELQRMPFVSPPGAKPPPVTPAGFSNS